MLKKNNKRNLKKCCFVKWVITVIFNANMEVVLKTILCNAQFQGVDSVVGL